MFTNLRIYIILGLLISALSVSFFAYYKISKSEMALLVQQKAQLEMAVKLNEQTIQYQKDQAKKLSDANIALSSSVAESERLAFQRLQQIDDQELIQSSIKNPVEVEKKINDEYQNYNRILERMSTPVSVPN